MKRNIILFALILGIIFCSISSISATDNDMILNQDDAINLNSDLVGVSENSNINNNRIIQSVEEDSQIVEGEDNETIYSTYIDAPDIELYYKNGTRFEAYLFDENDVPIANQVITLNLNGVPYDKITDSNGKVSLGINLNPGTYDVKISYAGNNSYEGYDCNAAITIYPTINGEDITKYYKNETQYYVYFLDGQGNPLANASITININGVIYNRTTKDNGSAKLNINLNPGTYILTAEGPDSYLYSNTVKVLPTVIGNDLVKAYKDSHQYSAIFLDGQGNPLVNASVYFNINGVIYDRTTKDNGSAKLNINLMPAEYILTAYNSNDGLFYSNIITVLKDVETSIVVDNVTIIEKTNNTLTAVLHDSIGYTIPNQTVSLLIGDNWYDAITNDDGIAEFNVNLLAGDYNVLYQFNGTADNTYLSSNSLALIHVLKGKQVEFEINDDIIYQGNKLSVTVKDLNGTAANNVGFVFIINGMEYNRTTNANGTASIVLNLNPGYYNITYYVKEVGYDDKHETSEIIVTKNNVTDLSSETLEIYQGEGQKFEVVLSASGVPLKDQPISIWINGVSYNRTTNVNGLAGVTINLPKGNYTLRVVYSGNSKFATVTKDFNIEVIDLISTKFTVTSQYDITSPSDFVVKLTDFNGNVLVNKNVTITIGDVAYNLVTNGEGIAFVNVNLPAGIYSADCLFEKEYPYGGCQQAFEFRVINNEVNGNGYWLFGSNMLKADLASLASKGTGNIFLNFYAFTVHGQDKVIDWIKKANSYGIKVHIWVQSFNDGSWILPVLSDGTPNYEYFNKKIDEIKKYASIEGVSGIHLDYLRVPGTAYKYPGTTEAINEFVRLVDEAVTKINPNIILSAAVMPETTSNIYYYGQDVTTLGKYLDVIIPMVYKGNYKAGTSWITTTTKWFVDNSQGAQIWTGLQSYVSDDDTTPLSLSAMAADAQAAIDGGAIGVVLFRWGLANFIDFDSLDYPSHPDVPTGVEFTADQIKDASTRVKSYMEENGVLPDYVSIGDVKCPMGQFLYLMAKYVANYGSQSIFEMVEVAEPISPGINLITGKILKSEYVSLANTMISLMDADKSAPGSITTSIGEVPYSAIIYGYAKIITFVVNNNILPAYVSVANVVEGHSITVTMKPSVSSEYKYIYYTSTWLNYCPKCGFYGFLLDNPKHVAEGELTCGNCDSDYCGVTGKDKLTTSKVYLTRIAGPVPATPTPTVTNVSFDDIKEASEFVKSYYESNDEIPDLITISEGEFSSAQYLYLVSKAIVNLGDDNFSNIEILSVDDPSNPTGNDISSQLNKSQYLDLATRVANFIETYGQAPNYASSDLGKIIYEELVDSLSRVLAYYSNNGVLPNYVTIKYGGGSESIASLAKSLTDGLTSTTEKATALFNYVRDYISYEFYYNTKKGAEGTLSSKAGNCCDQSQLLVAMARAVNLTVRFATGTCTFSSGSTYGHVWTQFLINGNWINADPTSTRNSFGVIKNWNTASYTSKGTFDVLPY